MVAGRCGRDWFDPTSLRRPLECAENRRFRFSPEAMPVYRPEAVPVLAGGKGAPRRILSARRVPEAKALRAESKRRFSAHSKMALP